MPLIDFHVHIRKNSKCAKASTADIASAAQRHGIDGIVILDHGYHATIKDVQEVHDVTEGAVRAYRGIEVTVVGRYHNDDVIIISDMKVNLGRHEPWFKICRWRHTHHAVIILAHPFRRKDTIAIEADFSKIDAVEIASTHTKPEKRREILDLANQHGWDVVAASDAHKVKNIGGYATRFEAMPKDVREMGDMLRRGATHPMIKRLTPMAEGDIGE